MIYNKQGEAIEPFYLHMLIELDIPFQVIRKTETTLGYLGALMWTGSEALIHETWAPLYDLDVPHEIGHHLACLKLCPEQASRIEWGLGYLFEDVDEQWWREYRSNSESMACLFDLYIADLQGAPDQPLCKLIKSLGLDSVEWGGFDVQDMMTTRKRIRGQSREMFGDETINKLEKWRVPVGQENANIT